MSCKNHAVAVIDYAVSVGIGGFHIDVFVILPVGEIACKIKAVDVVDLFVAVNVAEDVVDYLNLSAFRIIS